MRLALLLCTLSAALCLASAVGQPEGPTKSSAGGYPKKVTTLKKRPTKTPSTAATSATGAQPTTTKPSKPRVKISSSSKTATTKTPALDAKFSNLPADDLEFIKELDKQFKLHGNKIKIKVERDNSTSGSGNGKKRTIDGELGYGYAHQGYDYTPPKFMFYPYSQHDIPATESPDAYAYSPADYEQPETTQPQHQHQQVTSVTIEPSYSYELKPQTSYEAQQPTAVEQHAQPEQPQIDLPQPHPQHETTAVAAAGADEAAGYQEPVIVLRIPGPAKYAAHLQTLLQQYLEIRAAQYLQLLQDAEQRKHQQQPQPEEAYAAPEQHEQHEQPHYHPEVAYAHQLAPTPPPVQYGAIDDVYQTYKGRQQLQPQYEQPAPEAYYAPTGYQQPTQFYYAQPQAQPQYEGSYQPQLYLIAMAPHAPQYAEPAPQQQQQQHHEHHEQQQPIYVAEQEPPTAPGAQQAEHEQHEHEAHHELPITENNPRATHTKVIFNGQHGGADYAANMYVLPSHRPYQHQLQHQQHHHHHHHHQEQQQQQQQQVESAHVDVEAPAADYQPPHAAGEETMGITQPPYNYHAHGLKMRQGKRAAKAEHPADHQLQQIREYVREKLGAEMGSAVEYKTTQLLEG
ncbi:hypothetical protein KR044_007148 [Drosophila immigrans]|nr:hypothetical protein KR044_007148 [Drosophila immigrans]